MTNEEFEKKTNSGKLILVDFFATWCGPCQMMTPIIDKIKEKYTKDEDVEILTVDIVKAIAEEANLFNTADPDFFTIFNVKRIQNHYDIYELDARGKEQVLIENMSINITDLRNGRHLYGEDQEYFATIQKCDHEAKTLIVVDQQANQGTKRAKPRLVHYRKSITPHYSFSHYSPDF